MKRDLNNAGVANAYVESGTTTDDRVARLAEVPEHIRASVKSHVETVYKIHNFNRRKNAQS